MKHCIGYPKISEIFVWIQCLVFGYDFQSFGRIRRWISDPMQGFNGGQLFFPRLSWMRYPLYDVIEKTKAFEVETIEKWLIHVYSSSTSMSHTHGHLSVYFFFLTLVRHYSLRTFFWVTYYDKMWNNLRTYSNIETHAKIQLKKKNQQQSIT